MTGIVRRSEELSRFVLIPVVLQFLASSFVHSCENFLGEMPVMYVGSAHGLGSLSIIKGDSKKYVALLQLQRQQSDSSQPLRISGVAECTEEKIVVTLGSASAQGANIKVLGGRMVGFRETSPIQYIFGAYELSVVQITDFKLGELVGFWRQVALNVQEDER